MTSPRPAIVLVHGLWMTPLSWENWITRYEAAGYQVHAPAWPGLHGSVEVLRRDTAPYARLGITEIVDHYDRIIRALDAPPIIMGHSFGGAFVQVLLDRGLGAAGVAIDAAPTKGVLKLPPATLRSASPVLRNPANYRKAVMLTPKQFHYGFTNTLSERESLPVYERYAVPGPGKVLFQGALANTSRRSPLRIDYGRRDRAPLLLIGGGVDHTVPASVNRANHKLYKSAAIVAYREFPGRSHYTLGQDGWEDVAVSALDWAVRPSAS
jgi:pimeloyl-ACP methyl ester carboxylesterase